MGKRVIYYTGIPNLWVGTRLSKASIFLHNVLDKLLLVVMALFVLFALAASFTQFNLTEKQATNHIIFSISHPIMYAFSISTIYYEDIIRDVLWNFTVVSKNLHNDEVLEKQMLKKCKLYTVAFSMGCASSLAAYGIDGIIQKDQPFITVLTAWPDVTAKGFKEDMVRVMTYLLWWIFLIKTLASYALVTSLILLNSHQYKNLQSYFLNLSEIFKRKNLTQLQKEELYIKNLQLGIKMHAHTARYTKLCHSSCNVVISGYIFYCVSLTLVLMLQMVQSERNILPVITTGGTVLVAAGFFICNPADITIESSNLTTALYFSGWENCQQHASMRIRRLLFVAMMQANNPAVLRSFGILQLSYKTYVTILRFTYSVFSVIY